MVFTHLWPKRLLTLLNPEWTVEDWSITQVHIVPLCLSHDLQIGRGHFHVNVIFHTKNVKSTYKRSDLSGQCSIPVYVPWSSYEYFYSPCIRLQNSHIFCKHEWHSQYSNKRFGASVETARDAANIPTKGLYKALVLHTEGSCLWRFLPSKQRRKTTVLQSTPGWDASPSQGYPKHSVFQYPFIHPGK